MDCLEDKYIQLSSECKKTVKNYIEEVDEDPEIDEIFARACAPFWEKHCQVSSFLCLMAGHTHYS